MKYISVIIGLFFCLSLYSQYSNQTEYRTAIYSGLVAHNYSKLPSSKPSYIIEISLGQKCYGTKNWHPYYKYPTIYGSIFLGYPGNTEYGYFVGFSPQLSIVKQINNKLNCNFKAGIGLAYHTNPYNVESNPVNMLVGSHFIAIVNADFSLEYDFNNYNFVGLSVGAIHFSNGHVKLPNIGMNMPVMNIYYKHRIFNDKKSDFHFDKFSEIEFDNKIKYFVTYAAGVHEYGSSTKPVNGPKYMVNTVSFGISRNKNIANKHSFGINLIHYNSFQKFIIDQELNIGNPFLKASAINIFWGHEFLFGDFGFYSEFGLDIYKPFYRYFVSIYGDKFGAKDIIKSINSNKLGLRYSVINCQNTKLILGINLKVNMAQADFVEVFSSWEF